MDNILQNTQRIRQLKQRVEKVTQILARRRIQVVMRGSTSARVEYDATGVHPRRIVLPSIPLDASEELISAIDGFIDHEVGHVLHTNMKLVAAHPLVMRGHARAMAFWNVFEDTMMERRQVHLLPGSAKNLEKVAKFYISKYVLPRVEDAEKRGDKSAIESILGVSLIRAYAGQKVFIEFMRDKAHAVENMRVLLEPFKNDIRALKSTADCLALMERVVAKEEELTKNSPPPEQDRTTLAPEDEQAPENPNQQSGEEDQPQGSQEPGQEQDEQPHEGGQEQEEQSADSKQQEEPNQEQEEPNQEQEEPAQDPYKQMNPGQQQDDDEEQGEGGEVAESGELETEPEIPEPQGIEEVFADEIGDVAYSMPDQEIEDFNEALESVVVRMAGDEMSDGEYTVFTRSEDFIGRLKFDDYHMDKLADLEKLANQSSHMIKKALERAIAAKSKIHWQGGLRSGRIDGKSLFKLRMGDNRVFKVKDEVASKNTAVELVMDCSGSMNGKKIYIAAMACWALAQALESTKTPYEIIGFTTKNFSDETIDALHTEESAGRHYDRVEALVMPIFKEFGEKFGTEIKLRIAQAAYSDINMGNNIDGESISIAAERLIARPEDRKLMIVLSDGQPAASGRSQYKQRPMLRDVVKQIEKAGIEVIGIGIQSNAVADYYKRHMIIKDLEELPAVLIKELHNALLK